MFKIIKKLNNQKYHFAILVLSYIAFLYIILRRYFEYGFDLFLGWDPSDYAARATEIIVHGYVSFLTSERYFHLYTLLIVSLSQIIGDVSLWTKILPLIFLFIYVFLISQLLEKELSGYATLLLPPLIIFAPSTIMLISNHNRNLMALVIFMLTMYLLSRIKGKAQESLLLFCSSLVIAYTHIETYFIFVGSIIIYWLIWDRRSFLSLVEKISVLSLPLLIALPIFDFRDYLSRFKSQFSIASIQPPLDIIIKFTGGYIALLLEILGASYIVYSLLINKRRYQRFSRGAKMFLSYALFVAILLGVGVLISYLGIAYVPPLRIIEVMPTYLFMMQGISVITKTLKEYLMQRKNISEILWNILVWGLFLVILILYLMQSYFFITNYLRPYISRDELNSIYEVKGFFEEKRISDPAIFVMFSTTVAWKIQIFYDYTGIIFKDNRFIFYGTICDLMKFRRPSKYLFGASSSQILTINFYFSRLKEYIVKNPENLNNSYIVIISKLYKPPLDDSFLNKLGKYEVIPGIYILPFKDLKEYSDKICAP
jgi:hypothetical protein